MKKPDIISLPTSQMQAFCDVLGLGKEVQESKESMIVALEEADFRKLKEGVTHNFKPARVDEDIVVARKTKMGRV